MKVAILAEKYATDYKWYVDVILNLIRLAGDYVSEEVWYRVIQIVINREDVQGYAAKTVFEVGHSSAALVENCFIVKSHAKSCVSPFRLCKLQPAMKTWSKWAVTSSGSLAT